MHIWSFGNGPWQSCLPEIARSRGQAIDGRVSFPPLHSVFGANSCKGAIGAVIARHAVPAIHLFPAQHV